MRQLGGDAANTSLAATAFGGDMIKARLAPLLFAYIP